MKKILVVGCGFAGATLGRVLAEEGYFVDIIDKRNHIGGNAYDFLNEYNINIHKYGPHLFHTNNKEVFDFLSRFTEWIPYQHRVKAMLHDGRLVTLPVNQETTDIVGLPNIIDTFVRPYSEKMWGMPLEEIDPQIMNRVPVRKDNSDLYFPDDKYQGVPKNGYHELFKELVKHPNISLELNKIFNLSMEKEYLHCFNSMPIDEYYNFKFGPLPYRSLKFHSVTIPLPKIFPVSQVNFTHKEKYTRIIEWKNIPIAINTSPNFTTLSYEEPCSSWENNDERYYPIKDKSGKYRNLYEQYKAIDNPNTTFIGRLGLYAYLDMHQVINSSLQIAKQFLSKKK